MNRKLLIPGNLIGFQCEMCGECCEKWQIQIDRLTYQKLITCKELEDVKEKIERFPKPTKNKYAYIRLKENKKCPFIEDGLCNIQKKKGLDHLSDVCRMYPRLVIQSDRGMEISSYFSCKSACKSLDQKQTIEFFINPVGYNFYDMNNVPSIESKYYNKESINIYYGIEETLIDIIQYKKYSLRERMFLIGSFIEAVSSCNEHEKPNIIFEYKQFIGENIQDILRKIQCENIDIINAFKEFAKSAVHMEYCPEGFELYFKDLIENIELIQHDFFEKFEFEYIIENFFVCYIFRKNFFHTHKLIKEYYYMIINYVFILLNMNLKGNISKENVMESIYKCEKLLNHNLKFKDIFLDTRNNNDLMIKASKLSQFYK